MADTDEQPTPATDTDPVAERPSRKAPAEPEAVYTRDEILASAASYGTTEAHLGAALHLLGRPDRATRAEVEDALRHLDAEEV